MRRSLLPALLVGLFAVLVSPLPQMRAQTPTQPLHAPSGGTRMMLISISIPPIPGEPFTATVSTRWTRPLADGSTVTLENRRTIARDNTGRIFQERRTLSPIGDSTGNKVTRLEIADPQSHTIHICPINMRMCRIFDYYAPAAVPPSTPAGPLDRGKMFLSRTALGTDSIDGLDVVGTSETTTILAGTMGNDQDLQVVKEFWFSPQLGINLIEKRQDPRFGSQNFLVSEISPGEPDSALFDVPAGFRIEDARAANRPPAESSPRN
jgi:hypothetical protein